MSTQRHLASLEMILSFADSVTGFSAAFPFGQTDRRINSLFPFEGSTSAVDNLCNSSGDRKHFVCPIQCTCQPEHHRALSSQGGLKITSVHSPFSEPTTGHQTRQRSPFARSLTLVRRGHVLSSPFSIPLPAPQMKGERPTHLSITRPVTPPPSFLSASKKPVITASAARGTSAHPPHRSFISHSQRAVDSRRAS